MRKHLFRAVLITVLCLAVVAPAAAGDLVIRSGIDIWATKADGRTHYDFAGSPIPAGFFCANSEPFAGVVYLKGSPIATAKPGSLGNADTIVERLDDAAFNRQGVATTRILLRALNLESMSPIETSCGSFNVKASLAGNQPITRMRIVQGTPTSGNYIAPLALNVKLLFTPADRPFTRPLVLRKSIRFLPKPNATWTSQPVSGLVTHEDFVKVDTDGDGAPDSFLAGTSNFSAAGNPFAKSAAGADCHCADAECSEEHCPWGVVLTSY